MNAAATTGTETIRSDEMLNSFLTKADAQVILDFAKAQYGRQSQKFLILEYLSRGNRLNQADAESFWQIRRLAARISEIRHDIRVTGVRLASTMQEVHGKKFASYRLKTDV